MSLIDFSHTGRDARMHKLSSGERLQQFGAARRCAADSCGALLSRYNPGRTCGVHRGWLSDPTPRRRG